MSAPAYIALVRAEASAMPKVLTAPQISGVISDSYSGKADYFKQRLASGEVAQPPSHAVPRRSWAMALLKSFTRLQRVLRDVSESWISEQIDPGLPSAEDVEEWRKICWSKDAQPPWAATVLSMDPGRVMSVIEMFDSWLSVGATKRGESDDSDFALFQNWRLHWLFALLSALEECVRILREVVAGSLCNTQRNRALLFFSLNMIKSNMLVYIAMCIPNHFCHFFLVARKGRSQQTFLRTCGPCCAN